GVLVPADPNEIERLELNNPQADSLDGENLSLALVKERTGIDPATGGTGGGIVNAKRGIYSSQGTFAVLQQQDAQIIQSMSMQGMPEDLKQYYTEVLRAKQALYKQIVQNFGHDDY